MSWGAQEGKNRPKVLSVRNVVLALAAHLVLFLMLYLGNPPTASLDETAVPIDLTFVAVENPQGVDDEPPPVQPPEAPPPAPPPEPPKLEQEVPPPAPEAVVAMPPKSQKPPKPKPSKPEPPKKTRAELERERIERIRQAAKPVRETRPQTNGRTRDRAVSAAEMQRFLSQGYRPGAVNQVAKSEAQLCRSLIERAFHEHWQTPAYTGHQRNIRLQVKFDRGGRVLEYRITQSSGDVAADASVRAAAAQVRFVSGLSLAYLEQNPEVEIEYEIRPQ